MGLGYEKLRIREERAQTGQVALMKPAFLLSRSQTLKTYARVFEEECCICNLSLKRRRLNKSKDYPVELDNTVKRAFLVWSPFSEMRFSENVHCFEKTYTWQMKDGPFLKQNPF